MKKIFVISAVILSFTRISAQTSPLIITPGIGIGTLKLGMSDTEVTNLLKGDLSWYNYKEEMETFSDPAIHIDSIVQFVIGFDMVAKYKGDISPVMPIYSLYFKNDRLNFITVTVWGATDKQIKRVRLKNGLMLNDPMTLCGKRLGKNYMPITYGDYSGDHIYYETGMEAVYDNKKLTSVGIFAVTKDFKQLMAQKSAQLKREMEDLRNNQE